MSEYRTIQIKRMFTYDGIKKKIFEINSLAKEGWELCKWDKWASLFILRRPLTKEL